MGKLLDPTGLHYAPRDYRNAVEGLIWTARSSENRNWRTDWEDYLVLECDEIPDLDELLQMIDQPHSPRLYLALGALGESYIKETA